jgi:hypothetical protein
MMSMIFLVCPACLRTTKPLPICRDEVCRSICISNHIRKRMDYYGRMNSPPDLKQGHIIEAHNNLPLHLLNCLCTPCHPKVKLHGSPVLLYEIELAVVLGVEVTR